MAEYLELEHINQSSYNRGYNSVFSNLISRTFSAVKIFHSSHINSYIKLALVYMLQFYTSL